MILAIGAAWAFISVALTAPPVITGIEAIRGEDVPLGEGVPAFILGIAASVWWSFHIVAFVLWCVS